MADHYDGLSTSPPGVTTTLAREDLCAEGYEVSPSINYSLEGGMRIKMDSNSATEIWLQ
ncbi:MAG: hypothetical protein RLZZ32_1312 [Cyanobacteriota bacterium]|jgi:hypothetical protein